MPVRPLSLKICIATFPWFRQNKQDSFLFLVLFSLPTTNFFIFPRNVLFFGKKILLAEKSFFRPLSFSFLVYVKQRRQDPSRAKNTYFSSIKIIPKTPFSIKNQRIENYPVRFSLKREVFRQNRLFFIPAIKIFLRQAQEKSVFIFFSAVFSCALESISSFLYKNIFLRRFIFYAFKIYFCVVFSRETLFFRFFCFELFHMEQKNDIFICALSCFCG